MAAGDGHRTPGLIFRRAEGSGKQEKCVSAETLAPREWVLEGGGILRRAQGFVVISHSSYKTDVLQTHAADLPTW